MPFPPHPPWPAFPETEQCAAGPRPGAPSRAAWLERLSRAEFLAQAGLEEIYPYLTETAARLLGVDRVGIWLFDDSQRTIRCADLFERAGGSHSSGQRLQEADCPAYFAALESGEPIVADDALHHPATRDLNDAYLTPHGIGALLDYPVRQQGRLAGVLCHEQAGPARPWNEEQRLLGVALANLVSLALEHAALRQSQAQLHSLEERYLRLLEFCPTGIIHYDTELHITYSNQQFANIIGVPLERLQDLDMAKLQDQRPLPALAAVLEGRTGRFEGEYRASLSGRQLWVSLVAAPVLDQGGQLLGGIAIVEDATERKRAELQLRQLSRAVEQSPATIVITDTNGVIEYVNPKFTRTTGYSAEEAVGLKPSVLKSGETPLEVYQELWSTIASGGQWEGVFHNRRRNGELYWEHATISPITDDNQRITHFVAVKEDITEKRRQEDRIHQLAYFDELTGLPNRTLLHDRVSQCLAAAEREQETLALLFIDLDNFKTVNDSLGHFTGDRLLQSVAQRLKGCVRDSDTVSRLGGDEFVVVLADAQLDGASQVARKIIDRVGQPFVIDGHQLTVTPSIGISLFPHDARDFQSLLKNADTAMYQAKESGRNAYQFFTAEMNVLAFERLVLENALRQAVERQEFVLHYQPQVDMGSGRVIGAEALVRWLHPELGMVPPARFIPVAEDSGLIGAIGDWVLYEACRQNRAWQEAGLPPIPVAVNLSAVQLRQSELHESVAELLRRTGLESRYLELELTERTVMEDAEATVRCLRRLDEMGVMLSIDDFGTGYSSLSYLKRFPIDKLKIDQSFVRDIVADADDQAIAVAIISMGHSLRLRVIAEGVETAEQLEILHRHGCDEAQGFHFGRPMPADEFAAYLARRNA
ncbi:EAL domain-containing protein [Azospira oryzae]|uniref:bifunctional diguanylate cyclase/phosphodiesterase n=1 Tax=Azospira oryzae TaxID=146939 RepID=UPI0019641DD3|nr:EAL domain-containing protein [Azospira oryzae]